MTHSYYLVMAFGQDRPGMVAQLTRLIFQSGGSIEDASMTRLGGEFTMMLVVEFPGSASGARLLKRLPIVQKALRLIVNAKPLSRRQALLRHRSSATHLISIYGKDRPGIVYHAADAVARLGINITDLSTRILQRSGKSLYLMLLEVQIPSRSKATALKRHLQRLGRSLKLDVTLQDIDPVSL